MVFNNDSCVIFIMGVIKNICEVNIWIVARY